MTKKTDLQPWLDYFSMLMTHEEQGLLLIQTDRHESYVTQPALHALTLGDDPAQQGRAVIDTARRILTFAAWKSQQGRDYLGHSFAVHVVGPDEPHDPLYTIHFTPCHGLLRRWLHRDYEVNVIDYTDQPTYSEETTTNEVLA